MESLSVNVIVIPDNKTQRKARELGKILAENFESFYTLDDRRFIPHATIYQAQYPSRNLEMLKKILSKLIIKCKPFEISIGPYHSHHEFVWWNIFDNENLARLHKLILNKLNPLRESLLLPHLTLNGYKSGGKFTKEEAENVRKYGAVVVGKSFRPHVTLARLKASVEESKLYKILGDAECQFRVSEISIGEMGDHATVIKILERFPMEI